MTKRETHECYSWDARSRGWVAVDQGAEKEMVASCERRTATAKTFEISGAAFCVRKRGDAPRETPEDMGIEVVP
jgi:hypothetical protein